MQNIAPYEERLGDGLILRSVRDERDIQRYVELGARIWDARTAWTSDCLLHHHPEVTYGDFQYVEDERTGEMVSCTCLIPWQATFEQVPLRVAMLEMVGTLPAYRKRGLIRQQIRRFHQRLDEKGYDLSIIEGIPHYYRQFGYGYALDHRVRESLPAYRVPAGEAGSYRLRPATPADVPALTGLFAQAMAPLALHDTRNESYWRFLLERAEQPTRIIEHTGTSEAVGYLCLEGPAPAGVLTVMESSIAGHEAAWAALQWLRAEAGGGEIRLGWPESNTLVQLARALGSAPLPRYQWLVRIRHVGAFLQKLAPVFERRLAASPYAGLTCDLCLNLFREAFWLRFRRGRLTVEAAGFVDASMGADGGDIRVPPEAFPRLALGYRRFEELRDAWPDIGLRPGLGHLVDVVFPSVPSYLCVPYLFAGPQPPVTKDGSTPAIRRSCCP